MRLFSPFFSKKPPVANGALTGKRSNGKERLFSKVKNAALALNMTLFSEKKGDGLRSRDRGGTGREVFALNVVTFAP